MSEKKMLDIKLDDEEKEILEAFEKGALKRVENFDEEITLAKQAGENFFKKDARLNIRISSNDLTNLKRKAAYKGLPYQTFIAGLLHEIAAGHLNI